MGVVAPAWATEYQSIDDLMASGANAVTPTANAVRRIAFLNLHTDERCDVVYREHGACVNDALHEVNRVLRDWRNDEVHPIDPNLLDLLADLHGRMDAKGPFHVISGYRSPKTNAMLHNKSSGVATKSLHMQGKAIDIRLPGRQLTDLRDTALGMKRGGVGYYAASDFVHVDTGRVRRW
ncbi:MAG TPA: DUF882 domain-containing protein [Caulobacteraceae bacterium]